jgi:hypothetical protein
MKDNGFNAWIIGDVINGNHTANIEEDVEIISV